MHENKFFWLAFIILFHSLNAQELCINGSFEEWASGVPTGWQKESGINLTQSTDPVYHGSYSVGLQATSSSNSGIFQDILVQPGDSYVFKVSLYGVFGTGTEGIGFLISWYDSTEDFISSTSNVYNSSQNVWETDSAIVKAPQNAHFARLRIRCYASGALGGYCDCASFYNVNAPPEGSPPQFLYITRIPEFPLPEESMDILACVYDADGDLSACSLFYSINYATWLALSPDTANDSSYFFHIGGQSAGSFVRYYLLAADYGGHVVYSDTFVLQIGGFSFTAYFEEQDLIERLCEFISGATYSLDIALYEVFNEVVVDSLIAAKNRGVRIRIITDSSYYDREEVQGLISAGIPVIHEGVGQNSTSHIMHNKFIVRDFCDTDPSNDFVWTGSFNAGDFIHIDNGIILRSSEVAGAYTDEFIQMWGGNTDEPDSLEARTGARKHDVLNTHVFASGNDSVWVYFSPQDNPIVYVCEFASRARSSIAYLIYSFTRDDLKDSLIALHNRGIWVGGVHEDNSGINPVFTDLENAGVDVHWAYISPPYNLLHAKVMIVDTEYVITGSMNWSNNGTGENDENLVIIKNDFIARQYWDWFKIHFEEAGGQLGVFDDEVQPRFIAAPNPFVHRVNFPQSHLKIYDATGRLVRDLGELRYWDGKDSMGNMVKSGVYFVEDGKNHYIGKIVKVR